MLSFLLPLSIFHLSTFPSLFSSSLPLFVETGGYFSHSLAIMTDAAHMLSDFASFLISLFSIWMATLPPSKRMSFGWYRAGKMLCIVAVSFLQVCPDSLLKTVVIQVYCSLYSQREMQNCTQTLVIFQACALIFHSVCGHFTGAHSNIVL